MYHLLDNSDLVSITHWDRVTKICVGKQTIIGSDNGLSLERRQAIVWPSAGILLIGPLGTNFSEILINIQTFSLNKIRLKMSSVKCCSFRLGLNALNNNQISDSSPISTRVTNSPAMRENATLKNNTHPLLFVELFVTKCSFGLVQRIGIYCRAFPVG